MKELTDVRNLFNNKVKQNSKCITSSCTNTYNTDKLISLKKCTNCNFYVCQCSDNYLTSFLLTSETNSSSIQCISSCTVNPLEQLTVIQIII